MMNQVCQKLHTVCLKTNSKYITITTGLQFLPKNETKYIFRIICIKIYNKLINEYKHKFCEISNK